ncbi:hypothetical protein [Hymenobacter pini]|uniref:hypothetical protein n=1 Tax=Hymenobacter pini TaxID=2880879 RepID=UPI001CF26FA1|nr:hypothetical protein [Hymenobacter pini]MCA8830564.1 hypothetical protein [Hymenobacter pini]
MLTVPAPAGPVNPAEIPVAAMVLDAACIELHEPEKYDQVYETLENRHPSLAEELHYLMRTNPVPGSSIMAVAS